jgi:hypothetical protein
VGGEDVIVSAIVCEAVWVKSTISHLRAGDERLEKDPTDVGVQVLLFF